MKFSIIIPCYNEAQNLSQMVKRLTLLHSQEPIEWILVENGSTDESRSLFAAMEAIDGKTIRAVYVERNQGYGYGLRQGLAVATGDYIGWIHADMQIPPEALPPLMRYAAERGMRQRLLLKGKRSNRSLLDRFFTAGMSVLETVLFGTLLSDIGAIPVLFHRDLLPTLLDHAPDDFSIELFTYVMAKRNGLRVVRFPIPLQARKAGASSWNHGFRSKLRQSGVILRDSLKIRRSLR